MDKKQVEQIRADAAEKAKVEIDADNFRKAVVILDAAIAVTNHAQLIYGSSEA